MTYIIPSKETTLEDKKAFRHRVTEVLINRGMDLGLGRAQEHFKIRDLLPGNLGLHDWSVPADGKFVVQHKVEPTSLIGIYKILRAAPSTVTTIQFTRGSRVLGKHNIDILLVDQEGWLTEPYLFDPQDYISIDVEFSAAQPNYLILAGFVCETIWCR